MPIVYAVQNPHHLDRATMRLVPKFDNLGAAAEFGEVRFLLSPTANPMGHDPTQLVVELNAKLADITSDDYLLLVGSPVLIGWACAIAADYCDGVLNVLQWDGRRRRYVPIRQDLTTVE